MTAIFYVTVAGAALSVLLCCWARVERFLTRVLLVSYGLRVALAVSLYVVSAYDLPIFRELHLSGGFWRFARDAPWYHWNAVRIADAFRWGTEIPALMSGNQPFPVDPDFYFVTAFAYLVFGPHPLVIPLLNAALWSGIAVTVYLLARRLGGEQAGQTGAVLVSAWPSSYIWASQVLKDSLVIFFLLLALALCMVLLTQRQMSRFATLAIPLCLLALLLARFRFYLLPILVLAVGLGGVPAFVSPVSGPKWGTAARGLVLMGILVLSFVAARSIDPITLLSPSRPDLGHLQKARYLEKQGDYLAAAEEYHRALMLNRDIAGIPPWATERIAQSGPPTSIPQKSAGFSATAEPLSRIQMPIRFLRQVFSPDVVGPIRRGFARTGGASNVGEDIRLRNLWELITFVPQGLAYGLLAPFPWEWFSAVGDTGIFRPLSAIEVLLIFAVTPFFVIGVGKAVRTLDSEPWFLAAFCVVGLVLLGLAVTNIGIIFRLRLQFLVPLFVILAAYGSGALSRRCPAKPPSSSDVRPAREA